MIQLNKYSSERRRKQQIHELQLLLNEKIKSARFYRSLNNPCNLPDVSEHIIPLHIYTHWHTKDLPPKMRQTYDNLQRQNPEFSFHLFDDNDCREFIKTHFDGSILNAYDRLIPSSYKCDLWRFCVLYVNGGIYLDIKFGYVNNFKFIKLVDREMFVRDRPEKHVLTGLIICLPNNSKLLKAIHQIVENIKNNYYGASALCPTGPGLLGLYWSLDEINHFNSYFQIITINDLDHMFIVHKGSIILCGYKEYREEQRKTQQNVRYDELWNKRNIYK